MHRFEGYTLDEWMAIVTIISVAGSFLIWLLNFAIKNGTEKLSEQVKELLNQFQILNDSITLFGWDGDTLAWESSPAQDEGDTGRTVHYLCEPGSFVPVAVHLSLESV